MTCARVKAARALVLATPGLSDCFAGDSRNATLFYSRFGTAEEPKLHGVPTTRLTRSMIPSQSELTNQGK